MALYTRQEYEADMQELGRRTAAMAAMLIAHEIDPMQYRELARQAERMEKAYKQKLVTTRLVIEDRQRMGKSRLFAWVIGAQVQDALGKAVEKILDTRSGRALKRPILCKWAGWGAKYVPITIPRLYNLRDSGVTLLESGKGFPKKSSRELFEACEVIAPEEKFTKKQGEEIVRRGGMVFFPTEGGATSRDGWLLEAPPESWPYPPGFVFGDGRVQE